MFQQNRYNRGRYQAWLRSYIRISWKTMAAIFLTLLLSYGLFFLQPTSMREVLLLMLVTIFAYISSKLEEERS
ncbi:MAG: UDP-N-acetylmuramoyl-tripeptide--D-alanyl-D-alanine ligase, partial [Clostridium sp.]